VRDGEPTQGIPIGKLLGVAGMSRFDFETVVLTTHEWRRRQNKVVFGTGPGRIREAGWDAGAKFGRTESVPLVRAISRKGRGASRWHRTDSRQAKVQVLKPGIRIYLLPEEVKIVDTSDMR